MTVLVLHRNPLEPFPYDQWLRDYPGDVVVLAARDRLELFGETVPDDDLGYRRLEFLDTFDDQESLRRRASSLAAEFAVETVIAHHEADVDLAAGLRQAHRLAGAWPSDTAPFRDKATMKARLRVVGIETASYTVPRVAADARAFAELHGFPLVSKDRHGYNAIGLRILDDPDALEQHLSAAWPEPGSVRDDLLLETYVPGRMCHVDGLVVDGRMVLGWPSQYQYDLASFGTDAGSRVDVALDTDDPLNKRLLDLTEGALAALRPECSRLRDHAFHAEIFHTPDDRLVVCEIAARPAGAKVREVLAAMFGVNLGEYATRAQAGLPLPGLEEAVAGGPRPVPTRMAGQVLMMKRPGLVRQVPQAPQEDWLEHFWIYARPGQLLDPASGSSDFLVAAVASAPERTECERRLRLLGARFEAQTEIVVPA
ncbi:acetyl-CoA carboxylase biotin carboxylase subunit family protein [Micromonospora sp. NPDC048830]|uniref:ATP-grasp domain-containing protein n=1 Tax=Micromonospora sp. NPDC048830 TaxID=3364257 RepID=UPI0037232CB1